MSAREHARAVSDTAGGSSQSRRPACGVAAEAARRPVEHNPVDSADQARSARARQEAGAGQIRGRSLRRRAARAPVVGDAAVGGETIGW